MKKYIFKNQFDVFICSEGRSTVNPGAECVLVEKRGTKAIFFVNSNNFLPSRAASSLLHTGIEEYANEVSNFTKCTLKDNEIKNNISRIF